ncbi:entericidin A/B family lipoprotein [Stenotrophomonas sp. 24(2023)]|uniref:entericidin A/B family lipoprotein n=1 Tax=Stenotrophomonas sp. 24(2023) TaxID=3068324 RepID=UPI0027DF6C21|nr:entericidin A/B family lipoprotein [Stenotrophomonas sp. 24(2023)]WMJ71342.1 entericidin A/B family lipoprotein [Stenotrophomonas sp. 24(2023)]
MKRIIPVLLLALFSAGVLSGCNTVAGAGKDVQRAGQAVEGAANDCRDGKC